MFDAIAPTDFPRRFIRSRTIWLLRGLGFTLVAVTGWLAAPAISHATPIDYILSDASVILGGIPETISGSFIVDPGNQTEYGANIQITGAAPFAGVYSVPSGGIPLPSANQVVGFGNGAVLSMHFADNMSTVNNPLASVTITNNGNVVSGTAPTGAAVPIAEAITYTLANVTTTVFNGTPQPVTGFFIYDPLPQIQYSAIFSTPVGTLFNDLAPGFPREVISGAGPVIRLFLENDLAFAADPVIEIDLQTSSNFTRDTSPTGAVVPIAGGPISAPEPTSLAILGAAIGLFLLLPWAVRRAGQSHTDEPEEGEAGLIVASTPLAQAHEHFT